MEQVRNLIAGHTQGRDLGFLGEPRVNVLEINLRARPGRATAMTFRRVALLLVGFLAIAGAAATPPPSNWTHWGTDFSFLFDGYVDGSFNNPASGFNGLRNFDVRADTAHVNMGMITIDHGPAPVGFHLDAGFGEAFDIIHATDKAPDELKYIQQAYVSFKPKSWHGVEVDAGEFWSPAGAEVVPTNQDWNYSRSLLFAWAIPYYHFGIRASFPVGAHFTGGVQVVQGWNNVKDNNSGKTVGLNGAYAWKKVTWTNVYYVGPEKDHTNQGLRHLYDTTVLVKPTDKIELLRQLRLRARQEHRRGSETVDRHRRRGAFCSRQEVCHCSTPGVVRRHGRLYHRQGAVPQGIHADR